MDWPIAREMRNDGWIRLHRGIYAPKASAGSPGVRAAAALAAIPRSVASHGTAAAVWRLELVRSGGLEHVTVPRARRRPSRRSLRVHAADLTADEVRIWRGLPVTSPVRTLHDLARSADRLTTVWAMEQALAARLVDRDELMACRVRRCRDRAGIADERSESPLETGIRLVLIDGGLPAPEVQIRACGGAFRIDLGYERDRYRGGRSNGS